MYGSYGSYFGNPLDVMINNTKTGAQFETDFIKALKKVFNDPKTFKITSKVGTTIDTEEGTDVIYADKYGTVIRLDPTLNFSGAPDALTGAVGEGKSKTEKSMPFLTETNIPAFPNAPYNFKIGIRIGVTHWDNEKNKNVYDNFKKPVVVVGLDMAPNVYDKYSSQIINQMERRARDLINTAEDCLTDYYTKDPEDRKDLYARPLQPNDQFRSNRFINEKYQALNHVDHSDHFVPDDYYGYTN